ncbi:MAG: DUF1848 family protein [Eggerthella lenta]
MRAGSSRVHRCRCRGARCRRTGKTRSGRRSEGACRCSPSVDIGTYDTCANGCVYCYANPGTSAAPCGRL